MPPRSSEDLVLGASVEQTQYSLREEEMNTSDSAYETKYKLYSLSPLTSNCVDLSQFLFRHDTAIFQWQIDER